MLGTHPYDFRMEREFRFVKQQRVIRVGTVENRLIPSKDAIATLNRLYAGCPANKASWYSQDWPSPFSSSTPISMSE